MNSEDHVCEESVYQRIYENLSEGLWRFAYMRCGDSAQADDLCQDAFIKLWKNCSKVKPGLAKAFLYRVATNTFLNQIAHQKVVQRYTEAPRSTRNEQSPQYLLEEKEFGERLDRAIASLTEAQRTAFLLNRIEGKKYIEIAEMLGISVKAVEKRMSQALKHLRNELKNNSPG